MRDDAPSKFALEDKLCGMSDLCIRALVRRAFGLFWDHALLLVSVHVILLLILVAGNYLLTISGNVLLGPFILGAHKIALRVVRNQNTDLSDVLSGFEYFLPAFLANILIHVLMFVALPLAPLVFLTYSLTFLLILDENLGFWAAMEKSRRMVWGNFKRWLVLGLMILAVNLAGALCFLVGLMATIPFSYLLITLAYEEELIAQKKRDELVRMVPPVSGEGITAGV